VDDDVEGTIAALQSKGVEIITCGVLAANAHDRRV
jgi:hypothetical protein